MISIKETADMKIESMRRKTNLDIQKMQETHNERMSIMKSIGGLVSSESPITNNDIDEVEKLLSML